MALPDSSEEFLSLQTVLRDDATGAERTRLQAKLIDFRHAIKQRIDRGVPPGEYNELKRVFDATTAAEDVLLAVWRSYHQAKRNF
jgi:hypothetical protein